MLIIFSRYVVSMYILKQLRDQGLPLRKLHLLSRLMYALPAWGPLLNVNWCI